MNIKFTTLDPSRGETKTYETFSNFMGKNPKRFGVLARVYRDFTSSMLTDAIGNIFYRDINQKDRYSTVDNLFYEWEVEVNTIERFEFAEVPVGDGANNTEIEFCTRTRAVERFDTFVIDDTRQQVFVVSSPVRVAHGYKFRGRLIDSTGNSVLNLAGCQIGQKGHYLSNAHSETHREGYTKQMYNAEKLTNCITTHRVDNSKTALFALTEKMFAEISNGNKDCAPTYYKLTKGDKLLIDNFMFARNSGNLFSKTNVDFKTRRSTIHDPITGLPVYIANGVVPQVEAFAPKLLYNKLTKDVMITAINELTKRSNNVTGNVYVGICNTKMWTDFQNFITELFKDKTDSQLWSEKKGEYIKVGNTFNAFEYGGNIIQFKVDKAFTTEFGADKGYCLFLDLTADNINNDAAIKSFTLEGCDFIKNTVDGIGGSDGKTSGKVSSVTSGTTDVIHGYSSVGVIAPFKSTILAEI